MKTSVTVFKLKIDSPRKIDKAWDKQMDCFTKFKSVRVVPDGKDGIQIICRHKKYYYEGSGY